MAAVASSVNRRRLLLVTLATSAFLALQLTPPLSVSVRYARTAGKRLESFTRPTASLHDQPRLGWSW